MQKTKIWNAKKSVILTTRIGKGCRIHSPVWIGKNVRIGNNCKIQAFAFIPDGVEIGDNCFVGPHACFTNDRYPPSNGKAWEKTIVQDNAVIGAAAMILCGTTIGEHAKVGMGSVVLDDVPPYGVVVGNPATLISPKICQS